MLTIATSAKPNEDMTKKSLYKRNLQFRGRCIDINIFKCTIRSYCIEESTRTTKENKLKIIFG